MEIIPVDKVLSLEVHLHVADGRVEDVVVVAAERSLTFCKVPLCTGRETPHGLNAECALRGWCLQETLQFEHQLCATITFIAKNCRCISL